MRCLLGLLLLISSSALAQLSADFSAVNTQGCNPFTVQFQDKSAGSPSEWFWDFGNGITSTSQNPSVTYTDRGNYTVRLIVKNSTGQDYEEKTNYIKIFFTPKTGFITDVDSGCAPLNVQFTDTTNTSGVAIKSWLWDFGDSTTSTQRNPAHTFSTGRFTISLTTETIEGCVSTRVMSGRIRAGIQPTAAFSASPLTGCASTERNFQNKSTGSITGSLWIFGDGEKSNLKNPIHHYKDTGLFTVKLIVSNNGCKDSTEIAGYMDVDGPVAKFSTKINCADRFTIGFSDISIGKLGRSWDFGDGTTSTATSVTHTYAARGTYIVRLVSTGTTCNDTAYDTVYVKTGNPEIAVTPVKSFYCKYDTVQFSVINYDSTAARFFSWDFGDSIITPLRATATTVKHPYTESGIFIPKVIIRDYAACRDTIPIINAIAIKGPKAQFQTSVTSCTDLPTNFKDVSVGDPTAPINQWFWSFGDGTTENTAGPFNYVYPFPGVYNVQLKVTDGNNCSDSVMQPIEIFSTPVVDAGNDTLVCAGSKITLNPTGATTYTWQTNPDLSCTNCANPVAKPHKPAVYYVTGTSNGCSASDSIVVDAQTKEKVTVQPDNYSVCQGNSVTLNASGTDNYSWTPANTLSNSTISNPVATPLTNTVYTVTGKDSHNCFTDTAYVNVTVNQLPSVNITDSVVQLMTGTTYTILASASNDVNSFKWSPGTDLSCTDCLQPVATINNTIKYTLTATNESGCSNSDSISIIAICTDQYIYVPNTFSPNNDGMNDYFFPRSGAGISIKSLTIFNRWGQMVFQKKDFPVNNSNAGWDGRYKNVPQAADAYVYMMELNCSGSKVFVKKGTITLLR
ncbi:MAG TPA: PKD domain-containing protein [Parafilimonas sp.]|nr:PKD domain-containing protein [Parafilimonas sp.]